MSTYNGEPYPGFWKDKQEAAREWETNLDKQATDIITQIKSKYEDRYEMADIDPPDFSNMTIALPNEETSILEVGSGGNMLVKINKDKTIEYGEDYTPDKAAMAFWEAMAHCSPFVQPEPEPYEKAVKQYIAALQQNASVDDLSYFHCKMLTAIMEDSDAVKENGATLTPVREDWTYTNIDGAIHSVSMTEAIKKEVDEEIISNIVEAASELDEYQFDGSQWMLIDHGHPLSDVVLTHTDSEGYWLRGEDGLWKHRPNDEHDNINRGTRESNYNRAMKVVDG